MIILKDNFRDLFKMNVELTENNPRLNIERERMIWSTRNAYCAAVYGTNSQLESRKTELHHAIQWTGESHMESRRMFEELTMKSRIYQENQASDCIRNEELRRNLP